MTDLTKQLTAALEEYSSTTQEEIQQVIADVAKQAQKKLSMTSPSRTGKYRKSWKVKIEKRGDFFKAHVHNQRYQLTHLLEYGHKVQKTGHAAAQPHIAAVERWAKNEVERRLKEVLKG